MGSFRRAASYEYIKSQRPLRGQRRLQGSDLDILSVDRQSAGMSVQTQPSQFSLPTVIGTMLETAYFAKLSRSFPSVTVHPAKN